MLSIDDVAERMLFHQTLDIGLLNLASPNSNDPQRAGFEQ
jgi:hypothetical protein